MTSILTYFSLCTLAFYGPTYTIFNFNGSESHSVHNNFWHFSMIFESIKITQCSVSMAQNDTKFSFYGSIQFLWLKKKITQCSVSMAQNHTKFSFYGSKKKKKITQCSVSMAQKITQCSVSMARTHTIFSFNGSKITQYSL